MALGSSRRDIVALVLRQGAPWMGVGRAAGALGVFAVSRVLRSLVHAIAPLEPLSITAAVRVLVLCACLALVGLHVVPPDIVTQAPQVR